MIHEKGNDIKEVMTMKKRTARAAAFALAMTVAVCAAPADMGISVGAMTVFAAEEAEKAAAVTAAPEAVIGLRYTGAEQALVKAGEAEGGTLKYRLGTDGEWSEEIPAGLNAGTYTVGYYAEGDGEHSDSAEATVEVKISKAIPNLTLQNDYSLMATGEPQPLLDGIKTTGGTVMYKLGDDGEWSDKIPEAAEPGEYIIYYKVIGDDNFYGDGDEAEAYGKMNYAFPYCYNCNRTPAFPIKGGTCQAYGLDEPLTSLNTQGDTVEGDWTLEFVGCYGDIAEPSDILTYIVDQARDGYSLETGDGVAVYELKDGGKHIAYGVLFAATVMNEKLFYIGDTWSAGGAGYVLTSEKMNRDQTFNISKDVNDIADEKIGMTGEIRSKIRTIMYGDTNCDGKINVSDIVGVLQFVVNPEKYPLSEEGFINADVDGEYGVTGTDAIIIQKVDAGLIEQAELPLRK